MKWNIKRKLEENEHWTINELNQKDCFLRYYIVCSILSQLNLYGFSNLSLLKKKNITEENNEKIR